MTLHGLLATASTTWERDAGTLPLLVAAPVPAPLVLAGRSLFWVPQGFACALGSLVLIGLPLHISLPVLRLLQCLPMLLLIGLSSYCLGLFLGALVLSNNDLRNVVSNAALGLVPPSTQPLTVLPCPGRTPSLFREPHPFELAAALIAGPAGLVLGAATVRRVAAGAVHFAALTARDLRRRTGSGSPASRTLWFVSWYVRSGEAHRIACALTDPLPATPPTFPPSPAIVGAQAAAQSLALRRPTSAALPSRAMPPSIATLPGIESGKGDAWELPKWRAQRRTIG